MGASYGSLVFKGSDQARVVRALRGRRAAVSPCVGDMVVVFDSACDDQDTDAIQALVSKLSNELACVVFALLVHDDDVLLYICCRNGEVVDRYNSRPNYFEAKQGSDAPTGGNAHDLSEHFDVPDSGKLHAILHTRDYTFETDRHRDMIHLLGLPVFTLGTALASLDRGEIPDGLTEDEIIRAADPPPVVSLANRLEQQFYEALGPENSSRLCKREGCNRGTVPMSVLCKPHHFEMVKGYPCPFTH